MSVKPVSVNIESKNKIKANTLEPQQRISSVQNLASAKDSVSFTGNNIVVGLMDYIAAGGFATSFIIQDGLGFVIPRVGKGLWRGGKEVKDKDGNTVLDKNGKPKHHLNWAYARKEGIREIITGPSAFVIPLVLLKYIKKYGGAANNVKMDYIDSFSAKFTDFAKNNLDALEQGSANRKDFYTSVYKDIVERTINGNLTEGKLTEQQVLEKAVSLADKQTRIDELKAATSGEGIADQIKALRTAIEDEFMLLKKSTLAGNSNELVAEFTSSRGEVKAGGISEIVKALPDYFEDAAKFMKKSLKENVTVSIEENAENLVKQFRSNRLGTRLLTNLGLFGLVAVFYTQIPKLYNWGLKENPAIANQDNDSSKVAADSKGTKTDNNGKQVSFNGLGNYVGKLGEKFYNSPTLKKVSDLYELEGPVITGGAMATLLYGFCIPPRLDKAQDKYDFLEILVRDLSAFTVLLFGAKALARMSSDVLTKMTGLALRTRNMEGRNAFQKVVDYLSPRSSRHSILSSKQLESKYSDIDKYKNGVVGFMDFIEHKTSGGNLTKIFNHDAKVKESVNKILAQYQPGVTLENATSAQIREALTKAHNDNGDLIKEFYTAFNKDNGLLNKAKTSNSLFDFLSTLVLVPGFIIALTDICAKMTENRIKKEKQNTSNKADAQKLVEVSKKNMNPPTMEGFMKGLK